LDKEFLNNLDYVITLCAEEVCPVLNNDAKKLHWLNADPDNKNYSQIELKNSFKIARENIFRLIKKFQLNF
jgi:arsenate reductase